jgi:hypothetical protein
VPHTENERGDFCVDQDEVVGRDFMTHQELDTAFWPRPNRLVLSGTPAARRARYFYTDRQSPEILEERKRSISAGLKLWKQWTARAWGPIPTYAPPVSEWLTFLADRLSLEFLREHGNPAT